MSGKSREFRHRLGKRLAADDIAAHGREALADAGRFGLLDHGIEGAFQRQAGGEQAGELTGAERQIGILGRPPRLMWPAFCSAVSATISIGVCPRSRMIVTLRCAPP